MNWNPHDIVWLASLAFGALNAWQNKNIRTALLELQLSLVDRISRAEIGLSELRGVLMGIGHQTTTTTKTTTRPDNVGNV